MDVKGAEIDVEDTNGPVLLIASGDLSRVAYGRLKRAGRPHDDELAVYPDAGHALGGPAVANARANENSWRRATELLDGSLKV